MAEYGTLLQDLTNNITLEDLEQLKSACKEDIPSEKSEEITTGSAWFSFLESHNKLDKGGWGGGSPASWARPLGRREARRARTGGERLSAEARGQRPSWPSQGAWVSRVALRYYCVMMSHVVQSIRSQNSKIQVKSGKS